MFHCPLLVLYVVSLELEGFLGCNHLFISPPDHPLHAGRDFYFLFFWQKHITGGSLRRHGMLARLSFVMSVATDGRGLDPVLPLGVTKW